MEPDELMTVRVQYLVDSDPFNSLSMYPIPSRAPVFSFASAVPLATQLGALLRHLGAPQRVSKRVERTWKSLSKWCCWCSFARR
ncbi:AGAP004873-PA-like protein [Anopheles sinensis]|uniref:AGAP004873-PA-like protein n=1 Tax=Anopheles sinensis TaxID=74873 RepID=A0A084WJB4_ANOSI|nr:AGAP004873-PA-like protein [Anopheles sinensis]